MDSEGMPPNRQRVWQTAPEIVMVAGLILVGCIAGSHELFFSDDARNECGAPGALQ